MTIDIASTIAVSSKLEPFVLMSKSTKGAAAAKLFTKEGAKVAICARSKDKYVCARGV